MSESAIRLRDVHKRFGPTPIILGVSLDILPQQTVAFIGDASRIHPTWAFRTVATST